MENMRKGRTLAAYFFLFALLLNFPLIQLFTGAGEIWGIPKSYLSFFLLWLFMIIVFAWVVERKPRKGS